MSWLWIIVLVILAIIVFGALGAIGLYNGLIAMRTRVQESWNQVDVELQRRHDLVPSLVNIVKAYAGHERNTLEEVVRLRNQASQMTGAPSQQRAAVEDQLTQAVSRLLVTVEAYPDLKANGNFVALQNQLVEIVLPQAAATTTPMSLATTPRFSNSRRCYWPICSTLSQRNSSRSSMLKFARASLLILVLASR